jgi:enoyl-[acyl-carrier protein] reductase II
MIRTRITDLFGIQYPIIQGGMIWCSGWQLASAVSNAGGLGLIGGGSMPPEVFRVHIQKCKVATNQPFGVNIPLLFVHADEQIKIAVEEGVKIIFTSAGSPKKYTAYLKEQGIKVVHVVANAVFARKSEEAGVDAVVAEGFEAGGHNGKEETTTMVLIPEVCAAVKIPVIAAGGIASGKAMLASFALGAEAVQVGSRFVTSEESSAHLNFKMKILDAQPGDTKLRMTKLVPVRLLKNAFDEQVEKLENQGATAEQLAELLGKGRSRKGMFEGDLVDGELEIGQVSALISAIKPAKLIVDELVEEFNHYRLYLANL